MRNKISLSAITVPNVTAPMFTDYQLAQPNGMVKYGANDRYPEHLWQMYIDCAVHQSICDFKANKVVGSDNHWGSNIVNRNGDTLSDIVGSVALDYFVFGGYALQVVYNLAGEVSELFWLDFAALRTNKDRSKFYYYTSRTDYITYDAFAPNKPNKTSQVYYQYGKSARNVYPIPDYIGASNAILTAIEISKYHLNSIINGFASSTILSLNNGTPTEEEKIEIENKITEKFCGASNGNRLMVVYNDEGSKDSVTTTKIESEDTNSRYNSLEHNVNSTIYVAHRLTSPTLIGVLPKNTGFSRTEYAEAEEIFERNIIMPVRQLIDRDLEIIGLRWNASGTQVEQ